MNGTGVPLTPKISRMHRIFRERCSVSRADLVVIVIGNALWVMLKRTRFAPMCSSSRNPQARG